MNKARILIVDDQEEILLSLGGILQDEGHEVITARDGQEALHLVQSDSPTVVFLDIWIPGIDGLQTLKAIKRLDPQCSVIMMSGHGTIETAVKAIKLGAADYLEKPLNLEDVLHLVQKALDSRVPAHKEGATAGLAANTLIGSSEKAQRLRRALENASRENGSVWLAGEKGTGKEFAARLIHNLQGRDRENLLKVRCSDLTDENFDEIMLGKGADPQQQRPGKLGQAHGGTLLLIGIDRLAESLRPTLAQALTEMLAQDRSTNNLTGFSTRIFVTAPADPQTLARSDGFSPELAELLADRVIRLPSLSERPEDIPLYVMHFLAEAAEEFDRDIQAMDEDAINRLLSYSWPGNVKELKILIEHMVMTAPGPAITVSDLLIPGVQRTPSEVRETGLARADASDDALEPPAPGSDLAETRVSRGRIELGRAVRYQKTLRASAVTYGQGLHSGTKTGLTLSPLPVGSGIVFGQITSAQSVPAVLTNVESTEFSTSLRANGSSARTIEHLMAVFHVYGLTNVLVKISDEVPIMDGSALEYCNLVESAQIISQDEVVEEIVIAEPIELVLNEHGSKSIRVEPCDCFEVEYFLDYPLPIGKMHMTYRCSDPEDFKKNIAPARTFGFVKDMRMMDEMGLAGGGRLSNVVLLDEEKVVNPPLRFPDEFVRHKILDIIGDFYLLGRPLRGRVIAKQTGHSDNVAILKLINDKYKIL
ncbi:MAG: UDP-3-O-acyl-N-acetylglucosamine deacetylase [Thermodesulfobacteriota bacterium]